MSDRAFHAWGLDYIAMCYYCCVFPEWFEEYQRERARVVRARAA